TKSVGDLVEDLRRTASRRPELFFGGMFVVGLATARFLKASRRERQGNEYGDYGTGRPGASTYAPPSSPVTPSTEDSTGLATSGQAQPTTATDPVFNVPPTVPVSGEPVDRGGY
ncbi:MAG: hypothetical protein WA771_06555, partial [Chthoniobacterales bacterium]